MTGSDSESSGDFEDALESVEVAVSPTSRAKRGTMRRGVETVELPGEAESKERPSPEIEDQIENLTGDPLSGQDTRWRRLENLRRKGECGVGLEAGDEEGEVGRPGDDQEGVLHSSRESSVEGIYLSGVRSHHPFKVVECDSRSVQSDSRSGSRQLAGGAGGRGGEEASAPVPDIVQSVVSEIPLNRPVMEPVTVMGPPTQPLVPPRRKKHSASTSISGVERGVSVESAGEGAAQPATPPAAPASPASCSLEFQLENLNLKAATKGEFVVRPQDCESRRGGPGEAELVCQDPRAGEVELPPGRGSLGGRGNRKEGSSGGFSSGGSGGQGSRVSQGASGRGSGESRKSTTGSGGSEGGVVKQLNMFVRTKSDSGKRLTDQEILQQIKVKNLDTGQNECFLLLMQCNGIKSSNKICRRDHIFGDANNRRFQFFS